LVLSHGIISSTKQVFCDLAISKWLLISSGRRVALDANDTSHGRLLSLRSVILLHHLLLRQLLLLCEILLLARHSEIHQSFNSLFSLWGCWLQLIERIVKNLTVGCEELTHLIQVNLNNLVF